MIGPPGSPASSSIQNVSTSQAVTFGAASATTIKCTGGSGGITITLPSAIGLSTQVMTLKKVDTAVGWITINTVLSQTIDGTLYGTSYTLSNYSS
jgi:hypothetical protein